MPTYAPVRFPRPKMRLMNPLKKPNLGYLTVHNTHASQPEYWFAKGLDYWGFEYIFQADYFGGRRLSGGFVVDFLVFTKPMPTPVWINGEYWHRGRQLTLDYLQRNLLRGFRNIATPIIVWAKDIPDYNAARSLVRRLFK